MYLRISISEAHYCVKLNKNILEMTYLSHTKKLDRQIFPLKKTTLHFLIVKKPLRNIVLITQFYCLINTTAHKLMVMQVFNCNRNLFILHFRK